MDQQEWLLRRLRHLTPSHFGDGVGFVGCSPELLPPPAFHLEWFDSTAASASLNLMSQLASRRALLLFSSPFAPDQLRATSQFVAYVDSFGPHAPPVFWIPHTVAPEVRPLGHTLQPLDEDEDGEVHRIVESGLDGLLTDEFEGMRLALEVRKHLHKSAHMSQAMNAVVANRRATIERLHILKQQIHCILWDYLRHRMALSIPPCSSNVPTSYQGLGRLLARGTLGSTFALQRPGFEGQGREEISDVARVIEKATVNDDQDFKRVKRYFDVMLTVSCTKWQHPNVMRLLGVHHSFTQLVLRLECCGHGSLSERLMLRQRDSLQLPLKKVCSAIAQAFAAVAHLHVGPGICHRDVKPENFLLRETDDSIVLKLSGLDVSAILGQNSLCHDACGTVPFAAPEVHMCCEYDGRAADMWSLGILVLEVLCGARVVEKALQLKPPDARMARKVAKIFTAPQTVDSILASHARREIQLLVPTCQGLARGLLTTRAPCRWKAQDALLVVTSMMDSVNLLPG